MFHEIRSAAHNPKTQWDKLVGLLTGADPQELREVYVFYLKGVLQHKSEVRHIPAHWVKADLHPAFILGNALDLCEAGLFPPDLFKRPEIQSLRHLDLKGIPEALLESPYLYQLESLKCSSKISLVAGLRAP